MGVKPVVRSSDELFIEPLLTAAGFVACDKENGLTLRVKGESDAPLPIRRAEAELFHIGVAGSVQRLDTRPTQLRPDLLQEPSMGKDFGLHILRQFLELRLELVPNFDRPCRYSIMTLKTYVIKSILRACPSPVRVSEFPRGAVCAKPIG